MVTRRLLAVYFTHSIYAPHILKINAQKRATVDSSIVGSSTQIRSDGVEKQSKIVKRGNKVLGFYNWRVAS